MPRPEESAGAFQNPGSIPRGRSGACVLLVKDAAGARWFVRKVAKDPAAGPRLRLQALKQRNFAAGQPAEAGTPTILGEGEIDGCYSFDMELVLGTDAATYLRRCTHRQVVAFADRLCACLRHAATRSSLLPITEGSLFESSFAKLMEIEHGGASVGSSVLAELFVALERCRTLGELPPTACHGDLTFDNIVVRPDGSLCLVDLLDAPFEHYWQDVAKLHQDLSGGWYRLRLPSISQAVLAYLSARILDTAAQLDERYRSVHFFLLALVFARILPYAQDQRERDFVHERLQAFARLAARPQARLGELP